MATRWRDLNHKIWWFVRLFSYQMCVVHSRHLLRPILDQSLAPASCTPTP